MSSASLIKTPPEKVRVNGWVFYTSTALILLLTAILIIAPQEAGRLLGIAQAWLSRSFGWYYMVVIAAYLVFVVGLAFSSYGKLKLGTKQDTPDFSYGAWAGMLFSSGIGISLLYFGASEPLDHYFNPPEGTPASLEAARQGLQLTFLHWGLHGWAIYALVGLAVGYFAYRHNQPLALRSALYPLVGERWVKGAAGNAVDIFGMFVTLLGLVTNLGIGSMQVSSGLEYLFGMDHSKTNLLVVILVMAGVATVAAVSGVENGIRRLSNLNIMLFSGLLIFVLLGGETLHLLNGFVQNIGDYLNGIVLKTFDLYVYEGETGKSERWLGLWTVFSWAWWISWGPFVGMFIARISKGRTVRQLVSGVLLIPLGFTLAWLSIFGNTALDLVINQGAVELGKTALEQPSMSIYQLLEYFPAAKIVIGVAVFVGFVLFLTPADSGAVMMANLSCKGGKVDEDALDGGVLVGGHHPGHHRPAVCRQLRSHADHGRAGTGTATAQGPGRRTDQAQPDDCRAQQPGDAWAWQEWPLHQSLRSWGCFAALRGHARSHRDRAGFRPCDNPVGAGMPAKGRKAAPIKNPAQ